MAKAKKEKKEKKATTKNFICRSCGTSHAKHENPCSFCKQASVEPK